MCEYIYTTFPFYLVYCNLQILFKTDGLKRILQTNRMNNTKDIFSTYSLTTVEVHRV